MTWTHTTLDAVADIVSGSTPSTREDSFWKGDVPWVSAKDMKSLYLDDTEDHLTALGASRMGWIARPGTPLILVRGMALHSDVPIAVPTRPMAFNQDVKALRPKEGVDGVYLAYWLLANKPRLLASVDSASHGTGRLHTGVLSRLPVSLPTRETQTAIAQSIRRLDTKIALNGRLARLLSDLGASTFRSVLPDLLTSADGTDVQPGWAVVRLGDFYSVQRGLSYNGAGLTAAGVPMVNLGCFNRGGFDVGAVKPYSGPFETRHLVHAGDLVIANTDITQRREVLGTVGVVPSWADASGWLFSHHVFTLRPKSPAAPHPLLVLQLLRAEGFRDRAAGYATGTTVLSLPVDAVTEFKIALPPAYEQPRFIALAAMLGRRIEVCAMESRTLTSIRDVMIRRLLLEDGADDIGVGAA
jgi:type I restriction enzyme S subunit